MSSLPAAGADQTHTQTIRIKEASLPADVAYLTSVEPKRGVNKSTVYRFPQFPSIVINHFQTTVPNKQA